MAFAQHVATRLRDLPSVWLADQVALAETADEFGDDFEIADLSRLPELFDFHLFSETSQIWSGKGQRKYCATNTSRRPTIGEVWRSRPSRAARPTRPDQPRRPRSPEAEPRQGITI